MRKLAFLLLLAMFAGCSSSEPPKQSAEQKPKNAAAESKAPEQETGRTAFYKMYATARTWAPDAKPFRLQSSPTKDAPGSDGKAEIWHAWFASPSRKGVKPYTWSGGSGENMPERGVSFGTEDTFNPSNTSTQPFDVSFLKSDSDEAFKTAQEHGGAEIEKKNPGTPVTYSLDWDAKANELIWHVIYGDSATEYKLKVAVNASTGGYLKREK